MSAMDLVPCADKDEEAKPRAFMTETCQQSRRHEVPGTLVELPAADWRTFHVTKGLDELIRQRVVLGDFTGPGQPLA